MGASGLPGPRMGHRVQRPAQRPPCQRKSGLVHRLIPMLHAGRPADPGRDAERRWKWA